MTDLFELNEMTDIFGFNAMTDSFDVNAIVLDHTDNIQESPTLSMMQLEEFCTSPFQDVCNKIKPILFDNTQLSNSSNQNISEDNKPISVSMKQNVSSTFELKAEHGRPNEEILFFTRLLISLKSNNKCDIFFKEIIKLFETLLLSISKLQPIVRNDSKKHIMKLLGKFDYSKIIDFLIANDLLHLNFKNIDTNGNLDFLLNSLNRKVAVKSDEQLDGPIINTNNKLSTTDTSSNTNNKLSTTDTSSNTGKRKMKDEKNVLAMVNDYLKIQNENENIMVNICLDIFYQFNVVLYPVPRHQSFKNTLFSCLEERLNKNESSIKKVILDHLSQRENDPDSDILKSPILSPDRSETAWSPTESNVRRSIFHATIKEINDNTIYRASLPFIFSQLPIIFTGYIFILFNYDSNPNKFTSRINLIYPKNIPIESLDFSLDNVIAIVEYDNNCRTLCCLEKDSALLEEL